MRNFFRSLSLWILLAPTGCLRDLEKVHVPDLLRVTPKQEKKFAGRSASTSESADGGNAIGWPIAQIYSSLSPKEYLSDNLLETKGIAPLPESKDQYILIDLGCLRKVNRVIQKHGGPEGYPSRYRIDVADEHNFPYSLVFVGSGAPAESIASFKKSARCRFLRITLLAPVENEAWSVAELLVQ